MSAEISTKVEPWMQKVGISYMAQVLHRPWVLPINKAKMANKQEQFIVEASFLLLTF